MAHLLSLPTEVRHMVYLHLLRPYTPCHLAVEHDCEPDCSGPSHMALCWHGDFKKHICGLVLASSSCYNDFRSFLPAINLYMYEAYYGSGLTDAAIPAMFRQRVTSLVLVAAAMDSASGAKVEAVHLRRLKLFPKLSSIEVLPVPLEVAWTADISERKPDRVTQLLRRNEIMGHIESGIPIPGSVEFEEPELDNFWPIMGLNRYHHIGTKAFEVLKATRPEMRLIIKWTFCILFERDDADEPPYLLPYHAVEELLKHGESKTYYTNLSSERSVNYGKKRFELAWWSRWQH